MSPSTFAGHAVLSFCLMFGFSSCSSPQPKTAGTGKPRYSLECYWKGEGVSGSPEIEISLSEQRVRYFKGGQLVGVCPISSGREGHSTRPGSYRILEKDFHHRSTLYGAFCDSEGLIVQEDVDVRKDRAPPGTRFVGAEMRGFMRITGAVGMHEGYLPGYPASHGCIRLPGYMAEIFYRETPLGTPVKIVGDSSEAVATEPMPLAPVVAKAEDTRYNSEVVTGGETRLKAREPGRPLVGMSRRKPQQATRGQTLYWRG